MPQYERVGFFPHGHLMAKTLSGLAMDAKPQTTSQDQFDRQAAMYATSPVHRQGPSLPVLVDFAQPVPADRALDVATGTGNTAFAIAQAAGEAIGLDVSPGMLDQAEARATAEGRTNVRFQLGDAEQIPFEDGRFTLVTARHAPHHFHDVPRFLTEVRRVLAPGGRFVMSDGVCPTEEALDWFDRWQRLRDPSHFYSRTVAQWRALASEAGFEWVRDTIVPYRLDFTWWVRQSGAGEEAVAALKAHAQQATPSIREAVGLEMDAADEPVAFHEPMLVVRLEPR